MLGKFSKDAYHLDVLVQKDAIISSINTAMTLERQTQFDSKLNYEGEILELREKLRQQVASNSALRRALEEAERRAFPAASDLLMVEHATRISEDDRKRRMAAYGRLKTDTLPNSSNELSMIEALVDEFNSQAAQLRSLEEFKRLNCELQYSLEKSNGDLKMLKEKCVALALSNEELKAGVASLHGANQELQQALKVSQSDVAQLQAESKADRLLMIRMEEEHASTTKQRGAKFQQEYDALLLKYEKYKRIAQREKDRRQAQKVILRENNDFNELVVQRCKAIINE